VAKGVHVTAAKDALGHLIVRNLVKSYQTTVALDNVSLETDSSEVVAIAGGNGAGKSTMLKVISGTIAPDSGFVEFEGCRLQPGHVSDARSHGIAMVFQDGALCADASVLENLFLGAEPVTPLGFLRLGRMRQLAMEMIERYQLPIPRLDAQVKDLSGGQQKAVALGRALLYKPRLLLLDEPTSALGVREQNTIITNLLTLSEQGVGILLCTHSPDEILAAAKRVVVLRRGRLMTDASVDGLSRSDLAVMMSGNA